MGRPEKQAERIADLNLELETFSVNSCHRNLFNPCQDIRQAGIPSKVLTVRLLCCYPAITNCRTTLLISKKTGCVS